MGHVVNGWNNATDNNTGKSIGGSVVIRPTGSLTIIENFMAGPEQNTNNDDWRSVSDTIVTYAANSKISLAANYDYGRDTVSESGVMWHGVAGYFRYQPNTWFALSPRVEWYSDADGFTTGTAQTLKEATITTEFTRGGTVMRVEYRGDFSGEQYFVKHTDETVKSQNTLTIGFIYAFTTKAQ